MFHSFPVHPREAVFNTERSSKVSYILTFFTWKLHPRWICTWTCYLSSRSELYILIETQNQHLLTTATKLPQEKNRWNTSTNQIRTNNELKRSLFQHPIYVRITALYPIWLTNILTHFVILKAM